jgi:hypothetical protein
MAYTYSKLSTYTVGSGGIPSVTFLNIPQNYTDLVVKGSTRRSTAGVIGPMILNFNGDFGNNYSYRILQGDGATATSSSASSTSLAYVGQLTGDASTSNTFGTFDFYIPNYTSSNQKSSSSDAAGENNATTALLNLVANIWTGTAPISSITITPGAGLIMQHSTFHLYGIKAEL